MKKRLRVYLLSIILLTTTFYSVKAQLLPISLGVKGGVNFSNFGGDLNTNGVTKWQAGLTLDINLPFSLYIATGLDVQAKGAKQLETKLAGGYIGEIKYNPIYLQIPARLGYKFGIIPGLNFRVFAGPYFAYGIGGTTKKDESLVSGDVLLSEQNVDFFGEHGFANRFDWGLGSGIGIELLGRINISGGYDFGLVNITKNDSDAKVRNNNGYVTVGFKFF